MTCGTLCFLCSVRMTFLSEARSTMSMPVSACASNWLGVMIVEYCSIS